MSANYTRCMDLLADAGFSDPESAARDLLEASASEASSGASAKGARHVPIQDAIGAGAARWEPVLDSDVIGLLDVAQEWLFERSGDLASLLWLAQRLDHGQSPFSLAGFIFGLARRLWDGGRRPEAAALFRFFVDVEFDYGDLYTQQGIAYGFFESREPNPLVWKLIEHHEARLMHAGPAIPALRILELGCGIGNDALGLISSDAVASYEGVDLSAIALERQRERTAPVVATRANLQYTLTRGDFLSILRQRAASDGPRPNVAYSYSSLHYFNSAELREIMGLLHQLLPPRTGLFAFGIKGKDSIWDGQGVPLYRPDVWLNLDGQSRWFPSRKALTRLMDAYGFEIRLHEIHEHWSYSERGKVDYFHYVICSPR